MTTSNIILTSDVDKNSFTTTIAAIASPIGRGGVGIIRLSGSNALSIAQKLIVNSKGSTASVESQEIIEVPKKKNFKPRYAHYCRFYQADGILIDEGLVLYFPNPHSFTGEDVIELQGHGGTVLQNMLLARLFELGAKQATAGEFSYRAFENNKLDLVQAEAIADAIDATSQAAALSAMRSLTGEFSLLINNMLESLIYLRLYVEASIDFPDEEDVDFLSDGVIEGKLNKIRTELHEILQTAKQGQLLRDGINVVIAGRPNAGKSSLLNRLAGQERAIVTEIAGTTRDTLQETIVLNGLTINLTDTAGLRDTADTVEKIGIERARKAIEQADILLMVYDLTDLQNKSETPLDIARELFGDDFIDSTSNRQADRLLMVGNKIDLLAEQSEVFVGRDLDVSHETLVGLTEKSKDDIKYQHVNVSCETSKGLLELINALCEKVDFHPPENALIARTRHIDALKRTEENVNNAYEQLMVFKAGELVAESLRLAQIDLGEITGTFSADDLLGKIFGSFCIGK